MARSRGSRFTAFGHTTRKVYPPCWSPFIGLTPNSGSTGRKGEKRNETFGQVSGLLRRDRRKRSSKTFGGRQQPHGNHESRGRGLPALRRTILFRCDRQTI